MTKHVVTRELVGKIVCSFYITHQVIIYSWILAITLAYSPLKSTSSTTNFNRQKRPFYLRGTQLTAGFFFGCKSSHVVNHSMASYLIRQDRKLVASLSWNFYLGQTFAESDR